MHVLNVCFPKKRRPEEMVSLTGFYTRFDGQWRGAGKNVTRQKSLSYGYKLGKS